MKLTCIIIDDELHAISELADLINNDYNLSLYQTFMNIDDALQFLSDEGGVDIIFSDINMPGTTGLDAAKILQPFCRFLVFVTAYREHALTAFQENAAGYLVKPVGEESFSKLIKTFISNDHILLSNNLVEQHGSLFIKGDNKNQFIKVDLKSIKFIEAHLNYSMIYMSDGSHFLTYIILHRFEIKLRPSKLFLRVNRSNIISMAYFKEIKGNKVYLTTGENFTIGPGYKAAFFSFLRKRSLNF